MVPGKRESYESNKNLFLEVSFYFQVNVFLIFFYIYTLITNYKSIFKQIM